jgi:rod shape-determining protein MreD
MEKRKYLLLRIIFVVSGVLFLFVLQTALLARIPYLNIVPNLVLAAVSSFGILRGRRRGLWIGFASGLLVDIFYGGPMIGFFALIYMYIGFLNGLFSRFILKDMAVVPLIFFSCSEVVYHLYVYVFSYLLRRRLGFFDYLKGIMIPEFVLSLVFMLVLYGVLEAINSRIKNAERKGEMTIA